MLQQGMALAESLGKRVAEHGGAALIIDYGQVGLTGCCCCCWGVTEAAAAMSIPP